MDNEMLDAAPPSTEPADTVPRPPLCHPERSAAESKDLRRTDSRQGRSLADARDDSAGAAVSRPQTRYTVPPCHPERSEAESKDLRSTDSRQGRSLADARDDSVGAGLAPPADTGQRPTRPDEGVRPCAEEAQPAPDPDLRRHASRLLHEAEALRRQVPGFDLEAELRQNPRFARLTAPQFGLSLADAYFATHREEILAAHERESTRQALTAAASTLRAAQARPRENGGPSAVAERRSYSELSPAERAAFKSRLRRSWARGEKPGTEF